MNGLSPVEACPSKEQINWIDRNEVEFRGEHPRDKTFSSQIVRWVKLHTMIIW